MPICALVWTADPRMITAANKNVLRTICIRFPPTGQSNFLGVGPQPRNPGLTLPSPGHPRLYQLTGRRAKPTQQKVSFQTQAFPVGHLWELKVALSSRASLAENFDCVLRRVIGASIVIRFGKCISRANGFAPGKLYLGQCARPAGAGQRAGGGVGQAVSLLTGRGGRPSPRARRDKSALSAPRSDCARAAHQPVPY